MAVHHLNNIIHPILALDALVEEDPNVLVAMDDGKEEDVLAELKMRRLSLLRMTRVMACLMLTEIISRLS